MAKLLLATENFPYDSGEKSFILPELKRLTEKYEVTIISHAEKERTAGGIQMELPKGVQVVCHPRPVLTGADKIGNPGDSAFEKKFQGAALSIPCFSGAIAGRPENVKEERTSF